ncbi:acylphosphatase [Sulfurimonas sp. HSL3-7]|uniref:acylphosphatase n=1 Tax=Sulfonitrofixus jiaomeiensis TaxID=3131938 RepID=UPI0031F7C183
MKSYRFLISGRVQGVFYRANVSRNAGDAGFSGYVRNLDDGRVEAVVSCEEERLAEFLALLRRGSEASRVDDIEQSATDETFSGTFVVR